MRTIWERERRKTKGTSVFCEGVKVKDKDKNNRRKEDKLWHEGQIGKGCRINVISFHSSRARADGGKKYRKRSSFTLSSWECRKPRRRAENFYRLFKGGKHFWQSEIEKCTSKAHNSALLYRLTSPTYECTCNSSGEILHLNTLTSRNCTPHTGEVRVSSQEISGFVQKLSRLFQSEFGLAAGDVTAFYVFFFFSWKTFLFTRHSFSL